IGVRLQDLYDAGAITGDVAREVADLRRRGHDDRLATGAATLSPAARAEQRGAERDGEHDDVPATSHPLGILVRTILICTMWRLCAAASGRARRSCRDSEILKPRVDALQRGLELLDD